MDLELTIEQVALTALKPYDRNARTHSAEQVGQIAQSIAQFGFVNPVLVDALDTIVAGHGRVQAAQQLGLVSVPVIRLGHLTDVQRRALTLADNRIAENAGWDEALLRLELGDLEDLDVDLTALGFDVDELSDLFSGDDESTSAGNTEDDSTPEQEVDAITQPGDCWVMGEHRIVCGDATKESDYDLLLGAESAAMIFTDPPYNVDYGKEGTGGAGRRRIANDNLGSAFGGFLQAACTQMLSRCDGGVYIAMSSAELATLQSAFIAAGGKWSTFIIWAKNTFSLGRSDYQRQYEAILYGWPQGAERYWCGARDQGDVWFVDKPSRNDLHPTMKPVALVERALRNSSRRGNLVLDPFAGSGTTLIACTKLGRAARLLELDPLYVDVIVRRWQEYTGQAAIRESDGVRFDLAQASLVESA